MMSLMKVFKHQTTQNLAGLQVAGAQCVIFFCKHDRVESCTQVRFSLVAFAECWAFTAACTNIVGLRIVLSVNFVEPQNMDLQVEDDYQKRSKKDWVFRMLAVWLGLIGIQIGTGLATLHLCVLLFLVKLWQCDFHFVVADA